MPVQVHSSWSPDYGDVECATAMYISEVDMFAHRPFTALLWSGAFERHPKLKLVFTETGCSWILETLRVLEFKSADPIFKHFTKDLSLSPTEYFERNCFIGASFMPDHEGRDRHRIGLEKLMWGSDYPHLEGTWPNTMAALRKTMGEYPEDEIAALLGGNAAKVYDFDVQSLRPIADRIGPTLEEIRGRGLSRRHRSEGLREAAGAIRSAPSAETSPTKAELSKTNATAMTAARAGRVVSSLVCSRIGKSGIGTRRVRLRRNTVRHPPMTAPSYQYATDA